jgi:hypothetical protein
VIASLLDTQKMIARIEAPAPAQIAGPHVQADLF